jgi:hypothetical protein
MFIGSDSGSHNADDVYSYASDNNIPTHYAAAALSSPLISRSALWPEVKDLASLEKSKSPDLTCSHRGDLLTQLSVSKANELQFPSSTIFLHGLGCVAAALTKAFKIEYGLETIPVNLYVITSQQAGTGKSSVNNLFSTPIRKSYKRINDINEAERKQIKRELKKLEKSLENPKIDKFDEAEIVDRMSVKESRLSDIREWKGVTSNATIESLEQVAKCNDGMYNLVSAEADGINVLAGSVYGDSSSKKNIEIALNAWDGEWFSSERIGRDGFTGHVRASIAVLAQDDTIDTMLAAGESGRGLTERFLMLAEPSLLGHRDFDLDHTLDKSLKLKYESMIDNVISESDVLLNFDAASNKAIKAYKQHLEPGMRDGGIYSDNMVTGFIGKADKHVRKIAAVLHCIDNWQDGGDRAKTITDDYVFWAISIFSELSKTFINAADYMGYSGKSSESEKMMSVLSDFAQKGKLKISLTALRDKIRNVKPFRGSRDIANKIKADLIPQMESLNYCVLSGQTIHINPRLK